MLARLDALGEYKITVGIHSEDGAGTYEDGKTVAEIAEAAEYGIGQPARPFLDRKSVV